MKPNILVFFTDQQRFDTLGVNGQPLPVSPVLDRMAKEGVNFTKAYTAQPVCGPTRALLQTGLYPTQVGCHINNRSLPHDADTVARRLKRSGYDVAYVGKWHLASDETVNHQQSAVPPQRRGGYDGYWMAADILEFTSHGYDGFVFDKDGKKMEFTGYRPDCITDYALDYLDTRTQDEPFFLFLSNIEPHHQNNRDRYEGPEGSKEKYANFTPGLELIPGEGDWEAQYPDYLGCCNALDQNLGRVIDKLKAKGLYDNTIIIFTTDHGCHFKTKKNEAINGGFDDYKRNCYESVIHIPMVIRGPGFAGGKTDDRMVSLLDIPKTIITAAGADATGMLGDALQNPTCGDWKKEVYVQISESFLGRAIRDARYTYCVYAPDKNPVSNSHANVYQSRCLYDNFTDPLQRVNQLDNPDYSNALDDMKKRLIKKAAEAGETFEIRD